MAILGGKEVDVPYELCIWKLRKSERITTPNVLNLLQINGGAMLPTLPPQKNRN